MDMRISGYCGDVAACGRLNGGSRRKEACRLRGLGGAEKASLLTSAPAWLIHTVHGKGLS
jgi:hypothetical protein